MFCGLLLDVDGIFHSYSQLEHVGKRRDGWSFFISLLSLLNFNFRPFFFQVLWIYFGMMLVAFAGIQLSIFCGKAEASHKNMLERSMTKEISSAQV